MDCAARPVTFPAMKIPLDFLHDFVAVANGQRGKEESGKNNGGPYVRALMSATYLGPVNDLWCAGFVCWCWLTASIRFPAMMAMRPTTPRAFEFEDWARLHGLPIDKSRKVASPGDLVVFDFSHVGIVSVPASGGLFHSIEGNTSGGDPRNGGTVMEKEHDFSRVRSIIRLS